MCLQIGCFPDSVLHIRNEVVRLTAGHVDILVNVFKYSESGLVPCIALLLPLYSGPDFLRTLLSRLRAHCVHPSVGLFPQLFPGRGPLTSRWLSLHSTWLSRTASIAPLLPLLPFRCVRSSPLARSAVTGSRRLILSAFRKKSICALVITTKKWCFSSTMSIR